jgi:hypothetical protein
MGDVSFTVGRSRVELGALIMLVTLGLAAVVAFIAVLTADSDAAGFGTGLGIAFATFLAGATLAIALACLKRRRTEILALISIAAAGLALDLLALAIWLDIRNEAYAKIVGIGFVWTFYALIVLGLTLAVGTPRQFSRPVYLGAVVVGGLAGLITAWLVVNAGDDEVVVASSGSDAIPGAVLGDDNLVRALGAALVLLAALWFGALAASRMDEPAAEVTR